MPYSASGNTVYYFGDSALEAITDLKSQFGQPQVFPDIFNSASTSGTPFNDPEFPHNDNSVGDYAKLFDTADPTMQQQVADWKAAGWSGSATWIRVSDLCTTLYQQTNVPCFNCGDIGKTIGRNDIQQGCTGDCWYLSSVADAAMLPALIENVVPLDNTTNPGGVYHFRFWYQGAWVDVVVDDYLPCVVTNEQTFTVGTNFYPNNGQAEFWPMMMEKAFAKLNGSYSSIASNVIMIAQECLTGGFGEYLDTSGTVPPDTFQRILNWFDKRCIIGAGTSNGGNGIIGGHAYSVTGAHVITTSDGTQHNLIRCRNPWGSHEWAGDWCDTSPLWNTVSEDQKAAIGFLVKSDGEFWISYNDFLTYYSDINSCFYYNPTTVNQSGSQFQFAQFNTSWSVASNTAGGFGSPWQNPLIEVEIATTNATGLLMVGLLVKTKIGNVNLAQGNSIRIFPTGGATTFDQNFFNTQYNNEIFPAGQTQAPGNGMISFNQLYNLAPGKYLIVPCSLNAGVENNVLVRVYNEGNEAAMQVAASAGGPNSGNESD